MSGENPQKDKDSQVSSIVKNENEEISKKAGVGSDTVAGLNTDAEHTDITIESETPQKKEPEQSNIILDSSGGAVQKPLSTLETTVKQETQQLLSSDQTPVTLSKGTEQDQHSNDKSNTISQIKDSSTGSTRKELEGETNPQPQTREKDSNQKPQNDSPQNQPLERKQEGSTPPQHGQTRLERKEIPNAGTVGDRVKDEKPQTSSSENQTQGTVGRINSGSATTEPNSGTDKPVEPIQKVEYPHNLTQKAENPQNLAEKTKNPQNPTEPTQQMVSKNDIQKGQEKEEKPKEKKSGFWNPFAKKPKEEKPKLGSAEPTDSQNLLAEPSKEKGKPNEFVEKPVIQPNKTSLQNSVNLAEPEKNKEKPSAEPSSEKEKKEAETSRHVSQQNPGNLSEKPVQEPEPAEENPKKEVKKEEEKKGKKENKNRFWSPFYKKKRKEAELGGNQGGAVMSEPDKDKSAATIQGAWRGKVIRKQEKRENVAATEIQRIYRGTTAREKTKVALENKKEINILDEERKKRKRTLRMQEEDLFILNQLGTAQFLTFEQMKKDLSAKKIQRSWRATRGHKDGDQDYDRNYSHVPQARRQAPHKGRAGNSNLRKSHEQLDPRSDPASATGPARKDLLLAYMQRNVLGADFYEGPPKDPVEPRDGIPEMKPYSVEVEALGLAQLHRRVKDAAIQKQKEKERRAARAGFRDSLGVGQAGDRRHRMDYPQTGRRRYAPGSEARRRYQELLEVQQRAQIILSEHLQAVPLMHERKAARYQSIAAYHYLTPQLEHPLSLDEAREFIKAGAKQSPKSPSNTSTPSFSESWLQDQLLWNCLYDSRFSFDQEPKDAPGPETPHLRVNTGSGEATEGPAEEAYKGGMDRALDLHLEALATVRGQNHWGAVPMPLPVQVLSHEDPSGPRDEEAWRGVRGSINRSQEMANGLLGSVRASRASERPSAAKTAQQVLRDPRRKRELLNPKLFKPLVGDWVAGADVEDSLYWVGYASQPSKIKIAPGAVDLYAKDSSDLPETPERPRGPGEEKIDKKLESLLPAIPSQQLLQKVSLDAMSYTQRRQRVLQQCREEEERVARLANVIQETTLAQLRRDGILRAQQATSLAHQQQQHAAATKIQSLHRGRVARKALVGSRAQRRILVALQNLLVEIAVSEQGSAGQDLRASTVMQLAANIPGTLGAFPPHPPLGASGVGVRSINTARDVRKSGGLSFSQAPMVKDNFSSARGPLRDPVPPLNQQLSARSAGKVVSSGAASTVVAQGAWGSNAQQTFSVPRTPKSPFLSSRPLDASHGSRSTSLGTPSHAASTSLQFPTFSPRGDAGGQFSPRRSIQKQHQSVVEEAAAVAVIGVQNSRTGSTPRLGTPLYQFSSDFAESGQFAGHTLLTEHVVEVPTPLIGTPRSPESLRQQLVQETGQQLRTPTRSPREGIAEDPLSAATALGVAASTPRNRLVEGESALLGEFSFSNDVNAMNTPAGYISSPDQSGQYSLSGSQGDSNNNSSNNDFPGSPAKGSSLLPSKNIMLQRLEEMEEEEDDSDNEDPTDVLQPREDSSSVGFRIVNIEGDSSAVTRGKAQLRARAMLDKTRKAESEVAFKFKSGSCRISEFVQSALTAETADFDKFAALKLLSSLSLYTGVAPLFTWLRNIALMNSTQAMTDTQKSSSSNDVSASLSSQGGREIDVEAAAVLLGEMGVELGFMKGETISGSSSKQRKVLLRNEQVLLHRQQQRTREEEEEDKGFLYDMLHCCTLLRLLASTTESGKLKLADLRNLIEEQWVNLIPEDGIWVYNQLDRIKFNFLRQATRKAKHPWKLFDAVSGAILASKTIAVDPNTLTSDTEESFQVGGEGHQQMTVDDVFALVGLFGTGTAASSKQKPLVAENLVSSKPEKGVMLADAVVKLCTWSDRVKAVAVGDLRDFVCALPSFRVLQKKIQTLFRAIPTLHKNLLNSIKTVKEKKIRGVVKFQNSEFLSIDDFIGGCKISNLPISSAEALMLAHILNREGVEKSGQKDSVDVSLLRRIEKGEFLAASLR